MEMMGGLLCIILSTNCNKFHKNFQIPILCSWDVSDNIPVMSLKYFRQLHNASALSRSYGEGQVVKFHITRMPTMWNSIGLDNQVKHFYELPILGVWQYFQVSCCGELLAYLTLS